MKRILLFAVLLMVQLGFGQTNTWDGSSSADWNTAANWSLNSVPTNTQDVVIPIPVPRMPTISTATAECRNLTVNAGATLTVNNQNFTVSGTTSISGTLAHTSNNRTKIFIGLVTVNTGGTWNNTANEDIEFRGGVTNNGTFNAGTGANQFLVTTPQNLNGILNIPRVVVGDNILLINNGTLSIATQLSGTNGQFRNIGTLNIGGTITVNNSNFTTLGNTVNYNGANQTVLTVLYSKLILSGSGIKTFPNSTIISNNLEINTDIIANLGSSNHTAGTLSLGGQNQNAGSWGGQIQQLPIGVVLFLGPQQQEGLMLVQLVLA